jgi:hypothetical protein
LAGNKPAAVRTREDFLSFAEPGYAKAAIAFLVRPERGGSRVITETRVAGTSPDATRAMRRYWRAIRLGSGAIRRSWLAAIRRRAVGVGQLLARAAGSMGPARASYSRTTAGPS